MRLCPVSAMIARIVVVACIATVVSAAEAPAPVVVIAPQPGESLGAAHGRLLAGPVRMIAPIGMQHPAAAALTAQRRAALTAAIPPRLRAEITDLATAAGAPEESQLRGNLLADSLCSALVVAPAGDRPLRVARNMDYAPAELLGPATVVAVMRPAGARAFAAVGWPGMVAVVSGLNADGLSVCLIQHHGAGTADGMPAAFAARVVLEEAGDVPAAIAVLERLRIATAHYLILADATAAAAVWQEAGVLRRIDLAGPFLAIDNAGETGDRARALAERADRGIPAEDGWLRGVLRCAPITGINAQAMVIIPARRELQLARADAGGDAVAAGWWRHDVAGVLAGAATAAPAVRLGPAALPGR